MNSIICILPNSSGGGLERNVALLQNEFKSRIEKFICIYYSEGKKCNIICWLKIFLRLLRYKRTTSVVISGGNVNNVKVGFLCLISGKRHLILQRNIWSNESIKLLGSRKLYKRVYSFFVWRAHIVLANGQVVSNDLKVSFPFVNIDVLHNIMEPEISRAEEIESLKRKDYFISVGSNRCVKNYNYLIELWSSIDMPYRLKIVGQGVTSLPEEYFANTWPSNVEVIEYREDILDLMFSSKGLIHTSKSEGYSNVLLNAALLKIPVISTICGGSASEILGDITYLTGQLKSDVPILRQWLQNPQGIKSEQYIKLIERHEAKAIVEKLIKFIT